MRKLKITELGRMDTAQFKKSDKMPLVIVMDDVRSMYNVGAVFRTSDAFLVKSVYLCGITATPPHQEIHKTALGAEDSVDWKYFKDTKDAVTELQADGYHVFAIEQVEGSTMLQKLDYKLEECEADKFAIVMGNEVKGVKQEVVDMCNDCLEIPQFGTKHSLNVSTTAGMVIWEFAKILLKMD